MHTCEGGKPWTPPHITQHFETEEIWFTVNMFLSKTLKDAHEESKQQGETGREAEMQSHLRLKTAGLKPSSYKRSNAALGCAAQERSLVL